MMTKKTCNLKDEHGATESSSSSAFVRARGKNKIKLNNIRYFTYGRGLGMRLFVEGKKLKCPRFVAARWIAIID